VEWTPAPRLPPVGATDWSSGSLGQQRREVTGEVLELHAVDGQLAEQQQPLHVRHLQAPEVERLRAVPFARLPQLLYPRAGEASFHAEDVAGGGLELGDPEHFFTRSNFRAGLKDRKTCISGASSLRFSEMLRNLVARGGTRRHPRSCGEQSA